MSEDGRAVRASFYSKKEKCLSFQPLDSRLRSVAPVIVASPAYSVESIKVGIEGIAKSGEVQVFKNVGITHMSAAGDRP